MKTEHRLLVLLGCGWLCIGCVPASNPQVSWVDAGAGPFFPEPSIGEDGGLQIGDCPGVNEIYVDAEPREYQFEFVSNCRSTFRVVLESDALVEVQASGAALTRNLGAEDEPGWLSTKLWLRGDHTLLVTPNEGAAHTLHLWNHGPSTAPLRSERSLVWTLSELLDDVAHLGFGTILGRIAEDGHGAHLFADWLERFSTTAHSERAGPAILRAELATELGAQVEEWDLNRLPFIATAVHNRIDLRDEQSCGELRISFASTHPVWRPFHLLFIFDQSPRADDVSPAGYVHCHGTARRWTALSALDDESFVDAAKTWIAENSRHEHFLLAESEELTVSPWEWRQWWLEENPHDSSASVRFENRALFQTVDVSGLNSPGPLRDSFLSFVEENASGLDEQRVLLPAEFRPLSTRVHAGVPWTALDLAGIPPHILNASPQLRQHIESMGCAGCHAAADFVQVREDRSFSTFYENELIAREAHLMSLLQGELELHPHFGPLQSQPPLFP